MEILVNNKILQVLSVFIVLDVIFGVLRSVKEHKTNSTIGIDGLIRKASMMFTIAGCLILDNIVKINLINFIPENIRESLNLGSVGISDLFTILYCIFEVLSIFKNMYKLGVPLPIKLKNFLEKILKEFTEEVKEDKKEGIKNDK